MSPVPAPMKGKADAAPAATQPSALVHPPARQKNGSPSAGVALSPVRNLTLSLQQYFFWRASDHDAIYNKSGGVLRPATGTTARYVGAETDVLATYNLTRHIQGYAGYSHFSTGEFIEKTGKDKDSDFYYLAIQYTF